jgi:hypothetical protein
MERIKEQDDVKQIKKEVMEMGKSKATKPTRAQKIWIEKGRSRTEGLAGADRRATFSGTGT